MIGIYKIENLINGKVYIGQSINTDKRLHTHKLKCNRHKHAESDKPLYRAMKKYGIDNFTYEVIQECPKESLNKLELFYIIQYSSNIRKYGYNLNLQGSSATFNKLNNTILIHIIEDLKSGIKKADICHKYSISHQYLNLINKGECLKIETETYPIREISDIHLFKKSKKECLICGTLTKNKKFCSVICSKMSQRKVDRPDNKSLQEEFVNSTYTIMGRKYGVNANTVKKWLKQTK